MGLPHAHVLICRTDNIGDVILTLPLAGFLKQRYPGICISFLCRAYAAPVARNCRFIDHVITLEALDDPASYFAAAAVDSIIFAYPQRRLALAARKAGIRYRVGTSHRWFHWLACNRLAHFSRARSTLHEALLNFALLRPLGLHQAPALAALPALYGLRAQRQASVDALFSGAPFNLILHPKSNGNGREWPAGHYARLAQRLLAEPDIRLWITGSASEGAVLEREAAALLALPNVRMLCGQFDLDGLLALIGACDGLVASGTGPLHMAAALGRPALGLFPPLKPIDAARWGALGEQAQNLCVARSCSACSNAAACACMQDITPQQVADVVLAWHREKRKGSFGVH